MATKQEKEQLAKELQDQARPLFSSIGLDDKVIEYVCTPAAFSRISVLLSKT